MKKNENTPQIGDKRKQMTSLLLGADLREKVAESPRDFVIAYQICVHLLHKTEICGGIFENAVDILSNDFKRGGLYLTRADARRVLAGNSPFWHWRGTQLIVDLFDAEYEIKFANRSRAATKNIKSRWRGDTGVDTAVNTPVSTGEDTAEIPTPIYIKEKKTKENKIKRQHTPRGRAGGVQALPRSVEEVLGYMHNMPHCGLRGQEAEACARKFFDSGEECGWLTKNGLPVNDWHASLRKWVQSWQARSKTAGGGDEAPKNYDLSI